MRNDKAIRVADFAQPVHRLMNESYHRFILAQLQRAMEGRGWTFAVTSDQHEIPLLAKRRLRERFTLLSPSTFGPTGNRIQTNLSEAQMRP